MLRQRGHGLHGREVVVVADGNGKEGKINLVGKEEYMAR